MTEWTRRDLLKQAMVAALPPCCSTPELRAPAVTIEAAGVMIDLRRAPELRLAGGSARVKDAERNLDLIVVRAGRRRYAALDTLCTHGQGPVAYKPKHGTVQCTCWGRSEFALDGRVIGGPAKRPLRVYSAKLAGDTLTIEVGASS